MSETNYPPLFEEIYSRVYGPYDQVVEKVRFPKNHASALRAVAWAAQDMKRDSDVLQCQEALQGYNHAWLESKRTAEKQAEEIKALKEKLANSENLNSIMADAVRVADGKLHDIAGCWMAMHYHGECYCHLEKTIMEMGPAMTTVQLATRIAEKYKL